MLNKLEVCALAVEIMENDWHLPIVDGKCNSKNIDEKVFEMIYNGKYLPLLETDVQKATLLIDKMNKIVK